jgi:autotransporter-associated beta strand protein
MTTASGIGANTLAKDGGRRVPAALLAFAALIAAVLPAVAQDATWLASPNSNLYNAFANWTPAVVPTGTAFFGASNTTSLSFEDDATVGGWSFNAGASGYTFNNSHHLLFDGAGIVINGGSATIINNSGGITTFDNSSTAGNATITTNSGGSVFFAGTSSGGQAIFTTNAGGVFDMSQLTSGGTTAGSIAGAGTYFLGANALTVGSNNLSTTVSGVISDGGIGGGTGGALVKAGTGALTLSGANTYTGTTTVNAGTLEVDGSIAASSLLTVNNSGTLTGTGTVGNTQINSGGVFTPGVAGMPGTSMTVSGNLAFQSGAIYQVYLNPSTSTSASVTGTASLAGTVNAFVGTGSLVNKQYTILQSAGLGGTTFSGVNTTVMLSPATAHFFSAACNCTVNASGLLLPALTGTLSYTPNDVLLSLTANLGASSGGLNANAQSVTAAINNYFNHGGVLPPQFVPLFGLSGAVFDVRVTQLTGEASTQTVFAVFRAQTGFLFLMLDSGGPPYLAGSTGVSGFAPEQQVSFPPDIALAYASLLKAPPRQTFDQHWSAWGSSFGGSNTTNGDPVAAPPRSRRTTPALPPAWTIKSPPMRHWALPSQAAASIGISLQVSAVAGAMNSRPVSMARRVWDRPMCQPPSPSPAIGLRPTASRSAISSPRASSDRAMPRASRPGIAMACRSTAPQASSASPRTRRCSRNCSTRRATARPISPAAASGSITMRRPRPTPEASLARASTIS